MPASQGSTQGRAGTSRQPSPSEPEQGTWDFGSPVNSTPNLATIVCIRTQGRLWSIWTLAPCCYVEVGKMGVIWCFPCVLYKPCWECKGVSLRAHSTGCLRPLIPLSNVILISFWKVISSPTGFGLLRLVFQILYITLVKEEKHLSFLHWSIS